jgi:hypothetical protein
MILTLSSLAIGMDLSHNQLSRQIPFEIGGLINLGLLNFFNNLLSGQIPSTLGQCVHLVLFHMEGNHLEAKIPESFMELRGIVKLDMSRNNLSGAIPERFESFSLLKLLVRSPHRRGPKAESGSTSRPCWGRPTDPWLVGPRRTVLYRGGGGHSL